jgi:hypothetical protein
MSTQLAALVSTQPAVSTGIVSWIGAAIVTGALPTTASVRSFRRRAALSTLLVVAGLASLATALLGPAGGPVTSEQAAVLAVPAGIAALTTLPLLGALRATARAFAPAPGAPTPPILRASSAHPLLAIPVQLAALTAVLGATVAPGVAGPASPAVTVAVAVAAGLAIALWNAVRYGRLRGHATRPIRRPLESPPAGAAPPRAPDPTGETGSRVSLPSVETSSRKVLEPA